MKKNKSNYYDDTYESKWNTCGDEGAYLTSVVRDVIVKQGVISLYPDGPDKREAEEACEDARHQLLVAIGGYDLALKELRDYYNEHHDQLDRCVAWRPSRLETSHRLIEKAYNIFHKGN